MRHALLLIPMIAAAILTGCSDPEPVSDDDFLESVRARAETAATTTYESHTALQSGASVPKIEFETDHVTIYDVPNDGLGEGRIKIFNRGEGVLNITNVATSCNCTLGRVAEKTIPPGGSTDLIITINPQKIPGFEATRILTISSNDPNMSDFGLPVTAYIQPELEILPESTNLGVIEAGKGHEFHFLVRQLIDAPVNILEATTTHQHQEASVELLPESEWAQPGKREYDVTLRLLPEAPIGRLDSKLVLEVDLPRIKRVVLDMTGAVHSSPYSMIPKTSIFSDVAPGTKIEDAFRLVSDSPVQVGAIESDGEDITLSYRTGDQPNELIFDMAVGADVTSPRITQLWNLRIESGGSTYMEQLATRITTTASVEESD